MPLSDAERFVIRQLWSEFEDSQAQLLALAKKIKAFAAKASKREAEAGRSSRRRRRGDGDRRGDPQRAGRCEPIPQRQGGLCLRGAGTRRQAERGQEIQNLAISKQGSGLLRWALVESAWRLVNTSPKWMAVFSRLRKRSGTKRAIVAVARKLLCVLYAMLRTSTPYKVMAA